MLDLDPPVQLEEVEVAPGEHELRSACAHVADRLGEADGGVAHLLSQRGVECGRGRLLEHFLVAPLDRALALAERDDPLAVAEQLDLDVARPLDVALAEHTVVAECGFRLALRGVECLVELGGLADDAHPASAAPCRRLDHQREADLVGLARRHDRNAGLDGDPLCLELVAAEPQRLGARADEHEAGRVHRLGEVGVLGQESVAGVDRVGAGLFRCPDVLLGVEVAPDLDGLAGGACVQRPAIVGRDDGDGGDPELSTRAEDPHRDLAAIRYEELLDGQSSTNVTRHAAARSR